MLIYCTKKRHAVDTEEKVRKYVTEAVYLNITACGTQRVPDKDIATHSPLLMYYRSRFDVCQYTTGPLIESTTVWHDTSFAGPFPVETKATEISAVDTVVLFFKRTQDTTWLATGMSPSGSDWYYGEIPQVAQAKDTVRYYIYARDILQNESTDPTGAPTYYYSFAAYYTGVYEFVQSHQPFIFEIKHNPAVNRAVFSVVVSEDEQIALFIYDIVGRLIDKLTIGTDQAGRNEISWAPRINSGVYFYFCHSRGQQQTGKFVLLK